MKPTDLQTWDSLADASHGVMEASTRSDGTVLKPLL